MYGSSFPDTVSLEVSYAIDPLPSVTDSTLQVLMQIFIPRIDPTTVQFPAAPEVKAEKGSRGKAR